MTNKSGINWRHVFITSITTMVLSFFLLWGGCVGLANHIKSRRNCQSFNVDNYELRTHTDIPSPKKEGSTTCRYQPEIHTKSSVFILELNEKEMSNSIAYNNMKKITECTYQPFVHNPDWNDSISKLPPQHLYTKQGRYKADSWIYVLDSVNQTLWAELIEDPNYTN